MIFKILIIFIYDIKLNYTPYMNEKPVSSIKDLQNISVQLYRLFWDGLYSIDKYYKSKI